MKKNWLNIILTAVFLIGTSLLLYPTVSDYWNSFHQSQAIAKYAEEVALLDDGEVEKMFSDAHAYNQTLTTKNNRFQPTEEEADVYQNVLNISNGVMGYIEIPIIKTSLPIYHGVDESVLQVAVGHIPGTSLPVGGPGTHTVLSGHRGLPSAKLFTDLDQLVEGDIFIIRVADEVMTYEVDQILVVEPDEISSLAIEAGMDYATLVTCTPYGVNTHRLLVRGHRIENISESGSIRVTSDAMQIDATLVAAVLAMIPLLILVLVVLLKSKKRNSAKEGQNEK